MAAERTAHPEPNSDRDHSASDDIPWLAAAPESRGGERYVASWRGIKLEVQADLTGPWPLRSPWLWAVCFQTSEPVDSAAEGLADGLEEAKAAAESFARECVLGKTAVHVR